VNVDLLKLLNTVEREHHLSLLVRLLVVPILLGVAAWICTLVEGSNIEQEHVLEQIALHTPRLTLEAVVPPFVVLGVTG
jgi:hypothetical protein